MSPQAISRRTVVFGDAAGISPACCLDNYSSSWMCGQFARPAGYRTRLHGLIQSSFPMLGNVQAAAA